MKAGCSLLTHQDMAGAVQAGFDYVEFMGKYLVSLSEREFEEIQRKQDKLSLKVLGLNGYCSPRLRMTGAGFDLAEVRKYAKACAVRASRLGVQVVGIGSPLSRDISVGESAAEAMERMKQFLTVTSEEFAGYDIKVCLEALADCYCNFINFLPEAAEVVDSLQIPNLALVVDFYNMEHMNEADRELYPYSRHIAHAHISDDDGGPDRRSYLKYEKAKVHQKRIRRLLDAGYQGAVSLEIDCRIDPKKAGESARIMKQAAISGERGESGDVHQG